MKFSSISVICTAACMFICQALAGQERIKPGWQLFYSTFEWVPGAIHVNMQLIDETPKPVMPYLIIIGAQFDSCTADGFPLTNEYNSLFALSDSVQHILKTSVMSELTGTFTCQCRRTDYIYVSDTTGLRLKLYQIFNRSFKNYTPLLWIRPDVNWEAYRTFLYPSEQKLEQVFNEHEVAELAKQGDISSIPRDLFHHIYFSSKKERQAFIEWAVSQNYTVTEMKKERKRDKKWKLVIMRNGFIEAAHLTYITMEIKTKLKEYDSEYEKWACEIKRTP